MADSLESCQTPAPEERVVLTVSETTPHLGLQYAYISSSPIAVKVLGSEDNCLKGLPHSWGEEQKQWSLRGFAEISDGWFHVPHRQEHRLANGVREWTYPTSLMRISLQF